MGAPVGNTNAADAKRWKLAIESALEKRGPDKWEALTSLAEKLLEAAENKEGWALRELGDRIDGKSAQSVAVTGADGGPFVVQVLKFADSTDS